MTPATLYSRLEVVHTALEAIANNPPALAMDWPIVAGEMIDLSEDVKASIAEESHKPLQLFRERVFNVLLGGVAALQQVCNSDDDVETANVVQLTDTALVGLCHTLNRCFLIEEPAND